MQKQPRKGRAPGEILPARGLFPWHPIPRITTIKENQCLGAKNDQRSVWNRIRYVPGWTGHSSSQNIPGGYPACVVMLRWELEVTANECCRNESVHRWVCAQQPSPRTVKLRHKDTTFQPRSEPPTCPSPPPWTGTDPECPENVSPAKYVFLPFKMSWDIWTNNKIF